MLPSPRREAPTPAGPAPSLSSTVMEPDDPLGDDAPHSRLLPPDDRLWRHPSEIDSHPPASGGRRGATVPARTWLVAGSAGLAGALLALAVVGATGTMRRTVHVPAVERVAVQTDLLGADAATTSPEVMAISRRVQPAVVGIEVRVEGIERRIRGAGVVFRSDGHVLTNLHVVEGATRITVVLADGRRPEGRLVGADHLSDLAVVKVDLDEALPVATMGSADGLSVGQKVMTMGGPVGREAPAPQVGEIDALGHEVLRRDALPLLDMIHTTAPVASTSSGGALVDGTGAVVGIITALGPSDLARSSRTSLATRIDWARSVADQLLESGRVARGWIGVEADDLSPADAEAMGLLGGATVIEVMEASPAAAAGLAAADVLTSVDGTRLTSMSSLQVLLRGHRPGHVVTIGFLRGAETHTARVVLAERPAQG